MYKVLLFIIFQLLLGTTGIAQEENIRDKQRAIYLYNFTKYVEWSGMENRTHFTIGIIDPNSTNLTNEVRTYTADKKIKGLPVKVEHFNSISEISSTQILYLHQETGFSIDEITTKVVGRGTLIVGEEYPFHQCMINFVEIDGEFNFEINQDKINHEGLFVAPALISFAITSTTDWEALFIKSEKSRAEEKKIVAEQLTTINVQKEKIKGQNEEIEKQELKLARQKDEVEKQKTLMLERENELDLFLHSINQQKKRLGKQVLVLEEQKDRIENQNRQIINQNSEIDKKQREVDEQEGILEDHKNQISAIENKIEEKDLTLDEQSSLIDNQLYALYFSLGFGLLLFLTLFLVYRNNRNRKRTNAELEVKNAAISAQNLEIEQQKTALEKSTSTLIKSAKMASLGQVAANMAHEVNTPLGAIKTSAEQSVFLMDDFMKGLSNITENNTPETLHTFQELLLMQPSETTYRTTAEDRKIRKSLENMLKEKDVPDPRRNADILLMAGIVDQSEELDYLLEKENKEELIDTLSNILRRRQHMFTIHLAVEKASRVLNAFKSYSKSNENDTQAVMNLENNIDTVLIIYQNLLKRGIEVKKLYEGTHLISGFENKLTQVWTNIIHNAIQAIGDKGILSISTKNKDDMVLVSIEDNGTGIDPDIIDKIFDPFFTTKKGAEGTGLGLDIVNEIVKDHGGKIWVESTLGRGTTFYVLLPVN